MLPVIVVAGPTASGKSSLAIDIATSLEGEIITADSCQIYKGAPILSACPSAEDKQKVPHHLYEFLPPNDSGNVFDWLSLAVEKIQDCRERKKLPVVVGGTGLYVNNLIYGTSPIPKISANTRKNVAEKIAKLGLLPVYDELCTIDERIAEKIAPRDACRVKRAMEVYLETGKTISWWHQQPLKQLLDNPWFFIIKILPAKQELDKRCNIRFDKMLENGAVNEVKNILELNLDCNCSAMQTIGINEIASSLNGEYSLAEAVSLAKLHSRQYAKRQRTWFSRQLKADLELGCCYDGQKEILENAINCVKKIL